MTRKVKTRKVKAVSRALTMNVLNDLFAADDFNAYPVIDQAQMAGLVTKFDFLKCFALTLNSMVPRYDNLMTRTVEDVMIHEFIYVNAATRLVGCCSRWSSIGFAVFPSSARGKIWSASSRARMSCASCGTVPAAQGRQPEGRNNSIRPSRFRCYHPGAST